MEINKITEKIIGCAIEVHRHLGPLAIGKSQIIRSGVVCHALFGLYDAETFADAISRLTLYNAAKESESKWQARPPRSSR